MTRVLRHRPWPKLACVFFLQLEFAVLVSSCQQTERVPPTAHGVTYVLEWKRAQARELPDALFEVTNNLGFTVRVGRAHIVTRSIELVPCNPSPIAALPALFRPRPAFAGHAAVADPSALKNATVEAVLSPPRIQLATLTLEPQTYCHAHYLIARADSEAAGLPVDIDMVDQTLRIEGIFQRPDASGFAPFSIATAIANGKLFALTSRLETASASAVIVVRRNLDTIFDRVDFAAMPEKRIAREILQNLVDGTEIDVRVNHDAN